jgi:FkbM family methyltransferase
MNPIKNTIEIWRLAGASVGFRSRLLAFLCARFGNLSEKRQGLRMILLKFINCFARKGQVAIFFCIAGQPLSIFLRKGNQADYLVFGEMVMGGYKLPDNLSFDPTEVVDGGANIGLFSLFAHATLSGVKLTCFEPEKDNLVQLRKNLAANKINAEVIPKAMWSKTADLFFHPGQSYSGFVNETPSAYPISCMLPVVSDRCWLKLDIEGGEYEVLPALLKAGSKPAIISMEIHDFNQRGEMLLNLLKQHGYAFSGTFKPDDVCITICACKNLGVVPSINFCFGQLGFMEQPSQQKSQPKSPP